jgi:hypothetical protein
MRRLAFPTTVILAAALVIAGCGASNTHTTASQTQPAPSPSTTTGQQVSSAALEQAVREAVTQDHALSGESLWTDRIPPHPPATGGPALAVMRESAAQRRRQGIRVRTLSERFSILGVQLDPSYASATVAVRDIQRVVPYKNGRRLGHAVKLDERAHLLLHRQGLATRFIVWKVTEG